MTLFVENTREPDEYCGFQHYAIGLESHHGAGRRLAVPLYFYTFFRKLPSSRGLVSQPIQKNKPSS